MKKTQQKTIKVETLSIATQLLYWTFFIVVALFLQFFIEGVDAMVVGLLIIIPQRRILLTLILSTIFIGLQEATGILSFGLLLLEYSLVVVAFFMGRMFFAVGNFSFVFLLSLFISILHVILVYIFIAVQGSSIEYTSLVYRIPLQIILIPFLWYPMYSLYQRCVERGNTV